MKLTMYIIYIFLCFFVNIMNVHASVNENIKISFDYSDMTLNSIGVYDPKIEGSKSGLHAELIARKNGIDNLEKYFESSCSGIDKSSVSVKNSLAENFRSRGTEIFSNGILVVKLQAYIKQVFKISSKLKKFKTEDGDKIVFQLPKQIPLKAIRCGTLELNLENNKKIHVIPIESVKDITNKIKIVHLIFNKTLSALELDPDYKKDKEDEIIENSTIMDEENISSEIISITAIVDKNSED